MPDPSLLDGGVKAYGTGLPVISALTGSQFLSHFADSVGQAGHSGIRSLFLSLFQEWGAANAILRPGPTLSEIMRTGGWGSSSFRVYLDLRKAEEASMLSVLAVIRHPLNVLRRQIQPPLLRPLPPGPHS